MSMGGKVVQVYNYHDKVRNLDLAWVNTLDNGIYCGVIVALTAGEVIQVNDILWWQNGYCFWTRENKFTEQKLIKMSASGVDHPLGKEYQIVSVKDLERKNNNLQEYNLALSETKQALLARLVEQDKQMRNLKHMIVDSYERDGLSPYYHDDAEKFKKELDKHYEDNKEG